MAEDTGTSYSSGGDPWHQPGGDPWSAGGEAPGGGVYPPQAPNAQYADVWDEIASFTSGG